MSTKNAILEQQDELGRGVVISVAVHFAILSAFFLRSVFFPPRGYEAPPAIRVDVIGLPPKKQTIAEPQAPEPATTEPTPAKPETKTPPPAAAPAKTLPHKPQPDAINLNKTKTAIEKLKSLNALDKIKDDMKREEKEKEVRELEAAAAAARAKAGAQKIKGNVLSPGTDLTGLERLQHDEYRNALDRHIKPNWQLPEWLQRKHLRAQALVRVDAAGRLISRQLTRSSGNPDFDQSVLETIDRSAPLPAPPSKFVSMVSSDGIVLEFGDEGGNE